MHDSGQQNAANDNQTANQTEQQMFTSMSDIGFPKGKQGQEGENKGSMLAQDQNQKSKGELPRRQVKTGEIITTE